MAVSKDSEKGTWTSQIWIEDWQGKKKHKKKEDSPLRKRRWSGNIPCNLLLRQI